MMNSKHEIHEKRSLMMHHMVAQRFAEDPALVIECGLTNLTRWQQNGVDCDDFTVWEQILKFSPLRIPEILKDTSEEAIRLRQSSPFAGLVSEDERHEILSTTR
jgi:hypothetical protein